MGGDAALTASRVERHLALHCTLAFDRQRRGGLLISRITLIEGEEPNTLDLVGRVRPHPVFARWEEVGREGREG